MLRKTCVGVLHLFKSWVPFCERINLSELICNEFRDIILTDLS